MQDASRRRYFEYNIVVIVEVVAVVAVVRVATAVVVPVPVLVPVLVRELVLICLLHGRLSRSNFLEYNFANYEAHSEVCSSSSLMHATLPGLTGKMPRENSMFQDLN